MTEVTPEATTETTPRIVVSDVVQCLQIVDVAISRGGFRGSEISYVGKVRDSFAAYVEYQRKVQEATSEDGELPEEEVRITVADIAGGLQLMDAAIERGTFKGEEVSSVGKVRDNFAAFIEHQQQLQKEAEAEEQDAE